MPNIAIAVKCPSCDGKFTLKYTSEPIWGKPFPCMKCGMILVALESLDAVLMYRKNEKGVEWRPTKAPHLRICDGGMSDEPAEPDQEQTS